uniref:Uncharacterized protein n=1 Tax=Anguilla anguilla TaxID=7936 RepID=A0A0E9PYF2_ANGAN
MVPCVNHSVLLPCAPCEAPVKIYLLYVRTDDSGHVFCLLVSSDKLLA